MFQIVYTLWVDVKRGNYKKHYKTFTSNREVVEWLRDNNRVIDYYDYI